jgi:hypothetical protein
MTTQTSTSELEQEIAALDEQIKLLKAHRHELRVALATAQSAFKVGDVITWAWGERRRTGRVVEIELGYSGKPRWFVRHIRKDRGEGDIFEVDAYHAPELASQVSVDEEH